MTEKLMSIVVLNWNRLDMITKTINSIVANVSVPNEIIVVDNHSTAPGMFEYLDTIKGNARTQSVKIIKNDRNYGIAWGKNIGIYHSTGDWVLLSDDDIVYPKNFDKQLIEIHEKVPKVGVAGICVEPVKYPVKVINGVKCRPKTIGNCGGATMCLSKTVLKRIGFLNGSIYGLEDSDLDVRIRMLGLIPVYAESYGKHIDDDRFKEYRKEKNKVHKKGSPALHKFCRDKIKYKQTGDVYVPFDLGMLDREDPSGVRIFTDDILGKG